MIYFLMIALIFIGERYVKRYMDQRKETKNTICKGKIGFHKYHNHGVALNMLEKHVTLVKIITGTCIGVLFLVLGYFMINKKQAVTKVGLSLILGGALSNFSDRIEHGYVIDYFSFNFGKKLKHIIFNLADMFIMLGGILLVIAEVLQTKK